MKRTHSTIRTILSVVLASSAILLFGTMPLQASYDNFTLVSQLDARMQEIQHTGLFGTEEGKWRTKTELVIDPATGLLSRQKFSVLDPTPSRNLDFVWHPDSSNKSRNAVVEGKGTLTWRHPDAAPYDRAAIVSEYIGDMKDGRPDGHGFYRDRDGISYEGTWSAGQMQGNGTFTYPNGDTYVGEFSKGRPHGTGVYIESTGDTYRGTFVDGVRDGRGTVTTASGTQIVSLWRKGKALSPHPQLAQWGNGSYAENDVRLGVRVNEPLKSDYVIEDQSFEFEREKEKLVQFALFNTERNIRIQPASTRLMGMWKGNTNIALTQVEEGGTLIGENSYGVFSLGNARMAPLDLVLEVQNRSTRSVKVDGAYLEIQRSWTDYQPAIQITVGSDNGCSDYRRRKDYSPVMRIENLGWGTAQNVTMEYSFAAPGGPNPSYLNWEYQMNRPLGRSPEDVDFRSSLQRDRNASGLIRVRDGIRYIDVAGTLAYTWRDADGRSWTRKSPFRTDITLGKVQSAGECGEGGGIDRIARNPFLFANDRSNYRIALPFQRLVSAGYIARYAFYLDAKHASGHRFTVVLQLADGREIRSRSIDLLYFRPNYGG